MILRQVLVNVFLWLGVALVLLSCLGVLVFPSVYDRLHFTAPVTLAAICIAIAVLIHEDFSLVGNKALLIAVFMLFTAPLITHATGRAARFDEHGDWGIAGDEETPVEDR